MNNDIIKNKRGIISGRTWIRKYRIWLCKFIRLRVKDKWFFILPSKLFKNVVKNTNTFRIIENSAIGYPLEYYIVVFLDAYEYLILNYASNVGKSGGEYFTPQSVSKLLARIVMEGKERINKVYDPTCGFRVIIMTQANSQVNTRVLELLPKFKIKKMNCWCAV